MARIRTIKPEFPQSESMGRVSREARYCFILLWTIADDEGRLRGNSRMLASLLYPYDDDAGTLIDAWLGELDTEGCIVRYSADSNAYIQITKWLYHQKIDKPSRSKIPPFDESSRILANPRECSCEDQGREGKGREGKGITPAKAGEVTPAAPTCPPCPIDEIIETYHLVLPELPKFIVRNATRDGYIRTRWREFFAAGDFIDKGGGLDCFRWYFEEKVKTSKFLTGRAEGKNGSKPFLADLEWLMRPTNFAKVIEGKYT